MGQRLEPVVAGAPQLLDIGDGHHERLLALKAEVMPDGSATSFTCCFTNGPAFRVLVGFDEISPIFNTIKQASNLMVNRSRFLPDGGNLRLMELARAALRPADSDVLVDPLTGDRVFIHQFHDHSPIAIRHSIVEIDLLRARYWEAVARSLN